MVSPEMPRWHVDIDNMAEHRYADSMSPLSIRKAPDRIRSTPRRRLVHFRTRGASLGLAQTGTNELIHQLERGFSFKALQNLQSLSGLALPLLATVIGIPTARTLARRKASGKLAPHESERLLRVSSIFEKAVVLFEGDVPGAVRWLTAPKKALGERPPLAYSRTELGAREVENLIGRLEHGVFA